MESIEQHLPNKPDSPDAETADTRRDWTPYIVIGIAFFVFIVLLAYPMITVVLTSFIRQGAPVSFSNLTLQNFARFFRPGLFQLATRNTIIVTVGTVIGAVTIGVPMAYVVARVAIPYKTVFITLGTLPITMPPFIGAYAWIILLGRRGIITRVLLQFFGLTIPSIYGPHGIILAQTLILYPFVFLLTYGALSSTDPYIEEAAEVCGGSKLRRIRTVTLPLVLPSIGAGAMIAFMRAIASFGVPAVLGGDFYVLPTLMYFQITGYFNLHAANAIAMVLMLFSLLALALMRYISSRGSYVTVTSATQRAKQVTSRPARIFGTAFVVLVVVVSLLPHLTIVLNSFSQRWIGTIFPSEWTFNNYLTVIRRAQIPIRNSVMMAGVATIVAVILGALLAYSSVRHKTRASWVVDATIMLPFVIPGVVIGVTMLTTFGRPPIILSGTFLILIMAYVVRRLPFSFRSTYASLSQLDPAIEEGSYVTGGSWWYTLRRITLPLIAPGVLAGGIVVFVTLVGELNATIILYSNRSRTISTTIFNYLLADMLGPASALGTILILLIFTVVFLANRVFGKSVAEMFGMK